jgi:tripartite ATP-independent transporter DctP family solute receptor
MMFKVSGKLLLGVLMVCVLVQTSFVFAAVNPTVKNPLVVKLGITDSPTVKVGNVEENSAAWVRSLVFKSALEKYSQGRVKVELYANGRLGDNKSTLEQVLNGNLYVTATTDGTLAPFYKPIQVLSAPYVFKKYETMWDVLDGPFGQKFFNDMAAKTGIRILMTFNTGFRSFANNKRVLKVPADMKGLKMRVQDSPIYMEMVRACSGSPTPVAWMELYSALQTGVVDGMEHGPLSMLSMSFPEVIKYYTLNRHTICISMLATREKFLKSLPADLQDAFAKASQEASVAARNADCRLEDLALEEFKKMGVKVYTPTSAEMKLWKKTQKPVLDWLRKNVDSKLVNKLLKAVKKSESKRNK